MKLIQLNKKTKKIVTSKYLIKKCNEAFGTNKWLPLFSDPYYIVCSRKDLETFLAKNQLDKELYVTTVFDCDDFAFVLMGEITKWRPGIAFGICWYDEHAVNIWYSPEEDKIYLVEPQKDLIYPYPKAKKPILVMM